MPSLDQPFSPPPSRWRSHAPEKHGMTIGPPHSTAPSAGGAGRPPTGRRAGDRAEPGRPRRRRQPRRSGRQGATATGGQRPASVGPGADIPASVMLQPADLPAGGSAAEQTERRRAAADRAVGLPAPHRVPERPVPVRSADPRHRLRPTGVRLRLRDRGPLLDRPGRAGDDRDAPGARRLPLVPGRRTSRERGRELPAGAAERFAGDDALLVLRSHQPDHRPGGHRVHLGRPGRGRVAHDEQQRAARPPPASASR